MYSLLRVFKIVLKTDDSAGRMKVFMSVLRNSRKIRYSYNLYQHAPDTIKTVLVVLYGLKCYLSIDWEKNKGQELVFFASYPNERRVLNHVRNQLNTIEQSELMISLRHCLRFGIVTDIAAILPAITRLFRLSGKLVRRYHFLPACRSFSAVTYYMGFKRKLAGNAGKAVFIACPNSPECLGLAAAAHRAGKKVLFTNHSNAIRDSKLVAPLYADLVAVTNKALAELYQRHTPHELKIVPFPIETPQNSMLVPDRNAQALVVGIYLTALTDEARLQQVIKEISQFPMIGSVFIRAHPIQVVNSDLSGISDNGVQVEISRNRTLSEDIERTNIAVCGNSTVTIELLRGGRPVLYDHLLDHYLYDHHGFLDYGLVLPFTETLDAGSLDLVQQHYLNEEWPEKMRFFDSSYQMDENAMLQRFKAVVASTLRQVRAG